MRRTQLEHELMLLAEVDRLLVLAAIEVPEVQRAAVAARKQNFRHEAILERVRRSPFAGHHRVVAEMPPAVIGKLLGSALDFPPPQRIEALVVHDEDATGRLAFGVSKRRDVNAARAAMDRVRPGIAGLLSQFLR